eukprot:1909080-Karenia_brevis.AAC.1
MGQSYISISDVLRLPRFAPAIRPVDSEVAILRSELAEQAMSMCSADAKLSLSGGAQQHVTEARATSVFGALHAEVAELREEVSVE